MTKALFICKQGTDSKIQSYGYFRKFSGLFNSARLINEMLNDNNIISDICIAKDNNDIDRLVNEYKPDICIIEAYWVVPEKFEILHKLHPTVKWVIRIHSEIPFWATEGMAVEWTLKYLEYDNVVLSPNASRLYKDIKIILGVKYDADEIDNKVVYLPNYYPSRTKHEHESHGKSDIINIGCFGAIRPLKNQLIQAIAAIEYANRNEFNLLFHINGNRIEGGGDPILKNIRELFKNSDKHKLIEHPWQPHEDFLNIIAQMDIGMQVSFTESFNIVAADMISVGIPVVASPEISWISKIFHADPTNVENIVDVLGRAKLLGRIGVSYNKHLLHEFSEISRHKWVNYINDNN